MRSALCASLWSRQSCDGTSYLSAKATSVSDNRPTWWNSRIAADRTPLTTGPGYRWQQADLVVVEQTSLQISVSNARNSTNSVHQFCQSRMSAGCFILYTSANAHNPSSAADSVRAV